MFERQNIDKVSTREGYDRWSAIYDEQQNALVALEERNVAHLLGEVRGLTVADIGCGTGRHAIRLASQGATVIAVDFSEGMLGKAQAKPGAEKVRFVRHDLKNPLPLETGSCDRVMCCLVIDHVAELERLFRELGRICKKDGFLFVSVMHPAMMLHGVHAHFTDPVSGREIQPEGAANEISDYIMAVLRAGLTIEHLSEHPIDEAITVEMPRVRKYLGWPLLLLMKLRPPASP